MIALKPPPLISVLMPVFNGEKWIRSAIQSILRQTLPDFEFLIIDDGSDDHTAQIIAEFVECDSRIRYFYHSHQGITRSLNMGLSLARGKYIARQDVDDISLENRLEIQLPWLDQDGFDMCCSRSISLKHNRPIPRKFWLWLPRLTLLRYMNPHIHGSFMICKTVLQSVGGYDESFRFAQDYKLIYDLYSSQYSIKYLHEPLYCTGMSESSIGFTHSEAQRECANRVQQMFRSGKFKSASF